MCLLVLMCAVVGARPAEAQSVAPTECGVVSLYDAGLGTLPPEQSMTYQAINPDTFFVVSATQVYSGGVTVLNSLPQLADSAGYFGALAVVPELSRTLGFTVSFRAQVLAETHTTPHRAGFSVIVMAGDKRGIELGFWADHVWAQEGGSGSSLFTHAEDVAYDTTAGLIDYALAMDGDGYTLSADGTPILTGTVRDYTAFEPPAFFPDPYEAPNLIFLGDDSTRAAAMVRLAGVTVSTGRCGVYLPLVIRGD